MQDSSPATGEARGVSSTPPRSAAWPSSTSSAVRMTSRCASMSAPHAGPTPTQSLARSRGWPRRFPPRAKAMPAEMQSARRRADLSQPRDIQGKTRLEERCTGQGSRWGRGEFLQGEEFLQGAAAALGMYRCGQATAAGCPGWPQRGRSALRSGPRRRTRWPQDWQSWPSPLPIPPCMVQTLHKQHLQSLRQNIR